MHVKRSVHDNIGAKQLHLEQNLPLYLHESLERYKDQLRRLDAGEKSGRSMTDGIYLIDLVRAAEKEALSERKALSKKIFGREGR